MNDSSKDKFKFLMMPLFSWFVAYINMWYFLLEIPARAENRDYL